MKKILLFLCVTFFTILSQAQSVTVTQPNGGEVLYGCQTYQIKWASSGTSNYWNIDYSLNNGAIWSSVASNINITNGQYNWTVPMVASTTALVRVRDYSDTTKQDVSNAVFTIQLPITITSPNGSEVWQGLSTHSITWNPAGTSGIFNLYYSTDNGSTFNTIATNVAANNYTWQVPNNPSTQALVKVTDATTACQLDLSNAVFTISPAQPVLTSPNGGEQWTIDATRNITWTTSTFYTTVKLEYSTDNGASYNLITGFAPNTGTYAWVIPNSPSAQVLVRASNSTGSAVNDLSNAIFTIKRPAGFLTSPNGGETWRSTETNYITWDNSVFTAPVQIEYSINNGANWTTITTSAPNTGSYSWAIPQMNSSTQALVRITNNNYAFISDTSNAVFTILAPVTIDYPNLVSDTVTGCSTINVQWSSSNALETYISGTTCYGYPSYGTQYAPYFDLYYSTNGSSWNSITTVYGNCYQHSFSYSFIVPDVAPGTIQFRVVGHYRSYQYSGSIFWQDSSDYQVPVRNPSGTIVVTNPNGGVTMNALTNNTVTWTANGTSGFYDVLYSSTGAAGSYGTLSSNTSSSSYVWNANNTPSTAVYVKVQDHNNTCRKDISNAANTIIAATPVLTSPNGGEVWKVASTQNITWTANTLYNSVYIEYSTDNGNSWNIVTTSASNTGSYAWTLPNTITTQARIRISNVGNAALNDVSNAAFTINLPTPLLTSPNGGETWRSTEANTITWDASTVASNVQIEYSLNNGTTWTTITTSASNTGSYSWTIPQINTTTQALIRLTNTSFPSAIDTSNAVFTILAPVTIDYPNLVSDTVTGCSTINVQWSSSNALETYISGTTCYGYPSYGTQYAPYFDLYYSTNGSSWNSITTVYGSCYQHSFSYSFIVPDVAPGTIQFRVVGHYRSYQYSGSIFWQDSSDYQVPVRNPSGTIVVTNPNGGVTMNALTNNTVTWTANGTSGFYDVLYSSTGAAGSYGTLSSNTSSSSYVWNVNNTPSTAVYVKVQDHNNTCRKDISNAANTIIAATPVLTSPNGGEVWKVASTQNITWTANTLYNSVYIEYSTDNGNSWNIVTTSASNTGSYAWTLPNTITTQARIRISNVGNAALNDVSNAAFTINLPTPLLTSPNGGETWRSTEANTITWDASTVASNVQIEYSLNNGTTWTTITTSASNTGSYSWTIPQINTTTQALIRLTNTSFPSAIDTSNAVFTILAPVTIDYPNLVSDTVTGCSTINVQWSSSNALETYISGTTCYGYPSYGTQYAPYFDLYYSTNGSSWNSITTVYGSCYQHSFSYSFIVPDVAPGTIQFRVVGHYRSYQYSGSIFWQDSSDYQVPVRNPSGTIVVTNPNGGVTMNALTNNTVTWTANGTSGFYDVLYSSTGAAGSYGTLSSNTSSSSYVWNVNNTPSTAVYVKVQDHNNTCRKDISNAANTIIAATPVLTSPNGGEVWKVASTQNITWTANTLYNSVYIEYSTDNGNSWNIVTTAASNTGSYAWTLPNTITTQARIRISNVGNAALNDVSNAAFTINLPTPLLTSPNGGETWRSTEANTITWDASTVASNVQIEYSLNNGTTWTTITTSASNTGSYSWTITSDQYHHTGTDQVDQYFFPKCDRYF